MKLNELKNVFEVVLNTSEVVGGTADRGEAGDNVGLVTAPTPPPPTSGGGRTIGAGQVTEILA